MTPPLPTAGPPLTPDRETARRWAVEELTGAEYARAQPNPVLRGLEWLWDRVMQLIADLPGSTSTGGAVVAGVVALLAVAVLAWVATAPRRRAARLRGTGDVFADTRLSAAEHRARAREAAAQARWRDAIQEAFRGLARGLEERAVLDVRAGRTADEIAREAGAAFPGLAGELASAARVFDDVTYGGRPGSRDRYDAVAATDDRVDRARPASPTVTAAPAALP